MITIIHQSSSMANWLCIVVAGYLLMCSMMSPSFWISLLQSSSHTSVLLSAQPESVKYVQCMRLSMSTHLLRGICLTILCGQTCLFGIYFIVLFQNYSTAVDVF